MFLSHKPKVQRLVDAHLETETFFPAVLRSLNSTLLDELRENLQPRLNEVHGLYAKLGSRGEALFEKLILVPSLKDAFRQAEKGFTADLQASQFLIKDHDRILSGLFDRHYASLAITEETADYFGETSLAKTLRDLHKHLTTTLST